MKESHKTAIPKSILPFVTGLSAIAAVSLFADDAPTPSVAGVSIAPPAPLPTASAFAFRKTSKDDKVVDGELSVFLGGHKLTSGSAAIQPDKNGGINIIPNEEMVVDDPRYPGRPLTLKPGVRYNFKDVIVKVKKGAKLQNGQTLDDDQKFKAQRVASTGQEKGETLLVSTKESVKNKLPISQLPRHREVNDGGSNRYKIPRSDVEIVDRNLEGDLTLLRDGKVIAKGDFRLEPNGKGGVILIPNSAVTVEGDMRILPGRPIELSGGELTVLTGKDATLEVGDEATGLTEGSQFVLVNKASDEGIGFFKEGEISTPPVPSTTETLKGDVKIYRDGKLILDGNVTLIPDGKGGLIMVTNEEVTLEGDMMLVKGYRINLNGDLTIVSNGSAVLGGDMVLPEGAAFTPGFNGGLLTFVPQDDFEPEDPQTGPGPETPSLTVETLKGDVTIFRDGKQILSGDVTLLANPEGGVTLVANESVTLEGDMMLAPGKRIHVKGDLNIVSNGGAVLGGDMMLPEGYALKPNVDNGNLTFKRDEEFEQVYKQQLTQLGSGPTLPGLGSGPTRPPVLGSGPTRPTTERRSLELQGTLEDPLGLTGFSTGDPHTDRYLQRLNAVIIKRLTDEQKLELFLRRDTRSGDK